MVNRKDYKQQTEKKWLCPTFAYIHICVFCLCDIRETKQLINLLCGCLWIVKCTKLISVYCSLYALQLPPCSFLFPFLLMFVYVCAS